MLGGKIEWPFKPVLLAANPEFSEDELRKLIEKGENTPSARISAAFKLSYKRHVATTTPIQFTSLRLGDHVHLLHLPGEAVLNLPRPPAAFVEELRTLSARRGEFHCGFKRFKLAQIGPPECLNPDLRHTDSAGPTPPSIDDIRIREFLLRPFDTKVRDFRDDRYVALHATDPATEAVHIFRKYDRNTLPVVDGENKLIGIVTIDDVLDVAEAEATREMQKVGGMEALDEPYTTISLPRMVKKRATWLIVLFLGEMLTATAMQGYNGEIEKAAVLAMFLPLIISSGGNSGSQATTLIIRAMAVGEIKLRDWLLGLSREVRSAYRATGAEAPCDEVILELTYQYAATPWWTLQPDLQFIMNPAATHGTRSSLASVRRSAFERPSVSSFQSTYRSSTVSSSRNLRCPTFGSAALSMHSWLCWWMMTWPNDLSALRTETTCISTSGQSRSCSIIFSIAAT